MKPPKGSSVLEGKVYKIVKGLYGLKQSGREWNQEMDKFLRMLGFMPIEAAPCVFMRGKRSTLAIVVVCVDDTLIVSPSMRQINQVKATITAEWKIKDIGEVKHFLELKLEHNRETGALDLYQTAFVRQLLAEHLPKGELANSPMTDIPQSAEEASPRVKVEYLKLVDKPKQLANNTRLDISLATSVLARFMSRPSEVHLEAAQRVLKYLNKTKDYTLTLGGCQDETQNADVVTHTDANWPSDATVQRRSTSGSITMMGGCLVGWKSQLQKCTALSAVEAEYVAATEAARESSFYQQILQAIGLATKVPQILTDNMGCLQVSKDPAQHWSLKQIDTKYNYVRDNMRSGDMTIGYISTHSNLADFLTKPVGRHITDKTSKAIGLCSVLPFRRGVEGTSAPSPNVAVPDKGRFISAHTERDA